MCAQERKPKVTKLGKDWRLCVYYYHGGKMTKEIMDKQLIIYFLLHFKLGVLLITRTPEYLAKYVH